MELYRRLFRYAPEKKSNALLGAFFAFLATGCNMLPYLLLYRLTRQILEEQDSGAAVQTAALIVLALVGYGLLYFMALWCTHILGFRLERNLRKAGAAHLMAAGFAFFDTHSSGQIRKIIDTNAQDSHMIVAHLIPDQAVAYSMPIFLLLIMFAVDWRLGLLTLLLIAFGLICMKWMYGEQEFMKTYLAAMERMNSESVEYVRGMPVIKIFRASIQSYQTFYNAIVHYGKNSLNYTYSCRWPYVVFQIVYFMAPALLVPALYFMLTAAGQAALLSKFFFFACFSGTIFGAFMRVMYVGMYQMQAQNALEKLETLFEEMAARRLETAEGSGLSETGEPYPSLRPEVEAESRAQVAARLAADPLQSIDFCDVSFAYDPAEPLLTDFSLHLEAGRHYALVGSSGSGKSTLAKLLSGFYRVDQGEIQLNGRSLTAIPEAERLARIAFVFQNSRLFPISIFENVKIGNPEASEAEVMQALHDAQCDEIIAKFPDREHTLIGSRGVHLSGGEIQRLAIARALLKKAELIILDEASAAADPENEYEIQQAFSKLMQGKTVLMIAHRLSSIRDVDEILVMEQGRVVERGSHAELMAGESRYSRLQALYAEANAWQVGGIR